MLITNLQVHKSLPLTMQVPWMITQIVNLSKMNKPLLYLLFLLLHLQVISLKKLLISMKMSHTMQRTLLDSRSKSMQPLKKLRGLVRSLPEILRHYSDNQHKQSVETRILLTVLLKVLLFLLTSSKLLTVLLHNLQSPLVCPQTLENHIHDFQVLLILVITNPKLVSSTPLPMTVNFDPQ